MTKIEIVPATPELVKAYYGEDQKPTIRAVVAVRDGKVLGIAGVHRIGLAYAVFSEMTDELKQDKRSIVRGLREVKKITGSLKMKLYAKTDDPNNTVLIDRLGAQIWPC